MLGIPLRVSQALCSIQNQAPSPCRQPNLQPFAVDWVKGGTPKPNITTRFIGIVNEQMFRN
jgi:hypothetical protein